MGSAFLGVSTIWFVIGVGWFIAHLGMVDTRGRRLMSLLAFSVGSPALMFTLMSRASLEHVFSHTVIVNVLAVAAVMVVYLTFARVLFRPATGESVIGVMASSYTNAGNFGLPIAIALLGDATWTAPILLMQIGVILPICIAILDVVAVRRAGHALTWTKYLLLPFKNPITIGILLGLGSNLLHLVPPVTIMKPVEMIGDISVPLMLLAFGVSLRLDPLPGKGAHVRHSWFTIVLKCALHPLIAYGLGVALGLTRTELYGVVIMGALPAAQNVYVTATKYEESEMLARDAVFWSTILSVPAILLIAALLGPGA